MISTTVDSASVHSQPETATLSQHNCQPHVADVSCLGEHSGRDRVSIVLNKGSIMRKIRFPRFSTVLTALVASVALILSAAGDAADEPAAPKSDAPAEKSDTPAEEEKDPYALPAEDASSQEVELFMRRMGRMQPPELTPEGIAAHFNKVDGLIDQLRTRELDERTYALACNFKYEVLSVLEQFGDETIAKRRDAFVAELSKDERPEIAALSQRFEFMGRLRAIPESDDAERQQLIDDIAALLQGGEIERMHVGMAMQAASVFEQVAPEMAVTAYNVFAKHLETASDPELAALAPSMYGSARRLGLPGNPIEITGTTLAGEKFDIKQYKGKVVLVDFWATWCGPCIQELPNVVDNYEKYHGKGFEVVGISLDDNPEALNSFLEENELPWVTLFEPDETKRGFENPLAQHYGINGIPTVILVNQEGNVVSLQARGRMLGQLLADLLGEPLEQPASKVPTKQPLFKKSE